MSHSLEIIEVCSEWEVQDNDLDILIKKSSRLGLATPPSSNHKRERKKKPKDEITEH